ncbi:MULTISPECIES: AarF/ABC1/UbiB kinase family protein [unclassified Nocardia]|uniref:ABC1 kinase family protein n=1 Tax=unclassified Nocardia TaxID=2637762 RepID=UPI001CE3F89F|nr:MULTISPECIES: AarF/ABC1/UbiB kinase family protein [unclassified Nocardia]
MARTRAGRAAKLGGLAGTQTVRLAAGKAADLVRSPERVDEAERLRNALLAERLVAVLGTMRGAAMKLGQMLSLVDPGFVPPEYRDLFQSTLATLQDNAPRVPWTDMRDHLESELGGELATAFAEFEREPIAAASIGQVYRARLLDGRPVAVKVQYPGIEQAVLADLKNLRTLLSVYRFVHPALDTAALADEFEARIREELDYRIEARNTRLMHEAYRDHPFIRIPELICALSGQRVLVTEWLSGKPLREAYDSPLDERNRIAEILFRFYCGAPYSMHFYSGDPHPGNAVLCDDGSVGFLDFGLCKAVRADVAAAELTGLRAGIDGDVARIVELMQARGFATAAQVSDKQAYEVFLRLFGWYLRDGLTEFGPDLATDLVALLGSAPEVSLRPFNLPAEHALRGRAELQLVAILGQLRPHTNLHIVAREWIFDDEPRTELGRAHRDWVGHRTGSAPSMPPTSVSFQPESRSTVTW